MAENWTTIKESCRLLGKNDRTIRRWVTSGRLPCKRTSEGLRVDIAAVMPSGNAAATDRAQADTALLLAQIQHLTEQVRTLTEERDFLKDTLQRDQQLRLAELSTHQLASTAEAGRRPFWKFWQ